MTRRVPLFTFFLVGVTLLAYGVEIAVGGQGACDAYGLVPTHFSSGHLFSSLFLHDPANIWHVAGNMLFLAVVGTIVEGALGHFAFLGIYLAAGVAGGLMHVLVAPTSTLPLVGASGAIFGVMAVAAAIRPRLLGFALTFGMINIWAALHGGDGNVSFGCHIGGLVAGVLVAVALRLCGSDALEAA